MSAFSVPFSHADGKVTAPGLVRSEWNQCEFPPDLQLGRQALEVLSAFCRERGLVGDRIRQVELATAEAITNAIEHGCVDVPKGRVYLRWSWTEEWLEIQVSDPSSFCPEPNSESLPSDPLSESGRGLYLIASSVDFVEHRVGVQGHELVLRKKVGIAMPTAQSLEGLKRTVATMAEDLHVTYDDFTSVLRLSEDLATAQSFESFVAVACRRLRDLLQEERNCCCLRLLRDDGRLEMVYGETQFPVPLDLDPERACVEREVVRGKSERRVDDCSLLSEEDPLRGEGGGAFVDPVLFQGAILGVFSVTRPPGASPFSETQTNFIRGVSDFIGMALTTLSVQGQRASQQRAVRELEIAATIQTALLPKEFPENSNYRIYGQSRSAAEVGGDYFDVIPVRNVGVLLVIADVMGKGVPAALLATIFRTAVRCRLDLASRPGLLLSAVNQQISGDLYHLDMFITAQVAFLSYETHKMLLANAGHCPLLRLRSETGAERPPVTRHGIRSYPLGVGGATRFKEETVELAPADRLLFLTDGIFEIEDGKGDMLGIERLMTELPRLWKESPEQFSGELFDFLTGYSHQSLSKDDRTVLMVQRQRDAGPSS